MRRKRFTASIGWASVSVALVVAVLNSKIIRERSEADRGQLDRQSNLRADI